MPPTTRIDDGSGTVRAYLEKVSFKLCSDRPGDMDEDTIRLSVAFITEGNPATGTIFRAVAEEIARYGKDKYG